MALRPAAPACGTSSGSRDRSPARSRPRDLSARSRMASSAGASRSTTASHRAAGSTGPCLRLAAARCDGRWRAGRIECIHTGDHSLNRPGLRAADHSLNRPGLRAADHSVRRSGTPGGRGNTTSGGGGAAGSRTTPGFRGSDDVGPPSAPPRVVAPPPRCGCGPSESGRRLGDRPARRTAADPGGWPLARPGGMNQQGSSGGHGQVDLQLRRAGRMSTRATSSRSTVSSSSWANAAPRHRRTPPPNGIHVLAGEHVEQPAQRDAQPIAPTGVGDAEHAQDDLEAERLHRGPQPHGLSGGQPSISRPASALINSP